jgi:hypothetical protein
MEGHRLRKEPFDVRVGACRNTRFATSMSGSADNPLAPRLADLTPKNGELVDETNDSILIDSS